MVDDRKIIIETDKYEFLYEVMTDMINIDFKDRSWTRERAKDLVDETLKKEKERELIPLKNGIYFIVKKLGKNDRKKLLIFKEFHDENSDMKGHLKDILTISYWTGDPK